METKLNRLLAKNDSVSPTIKLQSTNIEECKSNLEIAMGYKDGMEEIGKIGDFTLHVVQGALKAKNNGLEKQGREGDLLDNIIQVNVNTFC